MSGTPGFDSCFLPGSFCRSSYTNDLKIGTPVATLQGTQSYRVSTGIGWTGVSVLKLSDSKFDLQLLSQCGSTCNWLRRSIPGIH